jgi:hypothetical protein
MKRTVKLAIAAAALTAMAASPAFAAARDCGSIWNLIVFAKKCA